MIRPAGLASALADGGFDTHLWFVVDPEPPAMSTARRYAWREIVQRHVTSLVHVDGPGEAPPTDGYAIDVNRTALASSPKAIRDAIILG